jgi:RNA polymerase sigma-70 factor, ECF subfamily
VIDVAGSGSGSALAVFQRHRPALFGIAYRMLGSVGDAEDVLQDAWLKWSTVAGEGVDQPRAYLARIVTNLSLNRLKSAAVRRESYVGPWLPEPLVTAEDDAGSALEQAEDVSLAVLVVLETLSPLERAVFVLADVFGYSFGEIAAMLDRSEASVRQVGSRARSHVQARRPRYDAPADVRRRITDEFLAACVGGDLNRMMAMLAPDVAAWTDGGGKIRAALRPLRGADHVGRWILGVLQKSLPEASAMSVLVNSQPGVLIISAGQPDSVAALDLDADGKITAIRLIRNPDKLRHLDWDTQASPRTAGVVQGLDDRPDPDR